MTEVIKTLREELAAEFANHGPMRGGTFDGCVCTWRGVSFADHLAEVATRITNARVEGLIRDAAEAGFKMRKAYGEPEYGVAYPIFKGKKPKRTVAFGNREEAEAFVKFWHEKSEKSVLLSRQWRAVR
jgi:hypothetical protein